MNEALTHGLFLAQLASCLFMMAIIWFVQVVHYPLFASVGSQDFPSYEQRHTRLITPIVGPVMLIEGVTAAFLFWHRPAGIATWSLCTGFTLLAMIWLSTAFIQVPCHKVLSQRFDSSALQRLVWTNWIRTFGWSLRGLLTLWMAWNVLSLSEDAKVVTKLKVGDAAPNFSATSYDGKTVSLSDYAEKRAVVLFFYPQDGTSICTKEVCAFRDSYEKFTDAGVEVIGVSSDDRASHQAFAERNKLPFPLISDTDGKLRKAFAVSMTFGLIPGRATYVIDDHGIVRLIFSAQFAAKEHVNEALMAISQDKRKTR